MVHPEPSVEMAAAVPPERTRPAPTFSVEKLEDRLLLSCGCGVLDGLVPDDARGDAGRARFDVAADILPKIVNGTPTSDFDTVGIIGDNIYGGYCTGTLISPTHVLTAGHCAYGVGDTQGVFILDGTTYTTSNVYIHPDYNNFTLANDIAIFELSEPVVGVEPTPLFSGTPQIGMELILVGFGAGGDAGGHNGDFGTLRVGTTEIEYVTSTRIEWDFDSALESNTAPGDSGGPAFVDINGELQVIGVTSGGTKQNAGLGDHSFDTRVDAFSNWIDAVLSQEVVDLEGPSDAAAGTTINYTITGATPGERVYFTYGTQPGSFTVPGTGLTLDMNNPKLLTSAIADENGTVTISKFVPSSLAGNTFLLQAIEPAHQEVSSVVSLNLS
ncbi:trypsin-like serine protease [Maioricimonas sp. JC845]|uniref:S1 family peptidase n=1 Tax=Maioricimonas sp. JC845 TaxID=3232138 RepID=UPI003458B3C3